MFDVIQFKGYEFDPSQSSIPVEKSDVVLSAMSLEILDSLPDDVSVIDRGTTLSIIRNNKRLNIYAGVVDLSGWRGKPLGVLWTKRNRMAVVIGVQFIDNGKFRSDINELANQKIAIGYPVPKDETDPFDPSRQYDAVVYGKRLMNSLESDIVEFFNDGSIVDAIIDALPTNVNVKSKSNTKLRAELKYRDSFIYITFDGQTLVCKIPHDYTQTDRVYGNEYKDSEFMSTIKSAEDIDLIDFDQVFADLYKNKNGRLSHKGSLGT